jgi:DNA-binding NarL/FixJ family response regulator
MRELSLLLVEDNPADLLTVQIRLGRIEGTKYVVYTASTMKEALTKLETIRPDIILLDLTLPGITGIDTYRAIRLTQPNTPVLILTGSYDTELAGECVRQGAGGYMMKDTMKPETLELNIVLAIEVSRRLLLEQQQDTIRQKANEIIAAQLADMPSIIAVCSVCGDVRDESIVLSGLSTDAAEKWLPRLSYLERHGVGPSHTFCPRHMPALVKETLKGE